MSENTKFCENCGAEIDKKAEICPKCGVRTPAGTAEKKNPSLAAILSLLFTGLGQVYNGQITKGILFIIIGVVLAALIFFLVGIVLYPLFWIYNIYDAYSTAKGINAGTVKVD